MKYERRPCPNCGEKVFRCACMRNTCNECGHPVGNITFTVCDKCWDIKLGRYPTAHKLSGEGCKNKDGNITLTSGEVNNYLLWGKLMDKGKDPAFLFYSGARLQKY